MIQNKRGTTVRQMDTCVSHAQTLAQLTFPAASASTCSKPCRLYITTAVSTTAVGGGSKRKQVKLAAAAAPVAAVVADG